VHPETPTDAVHLPNPLLPGFNPDPSCVQVGDWYYAVTSTFEYLPALPIYRSRDLASWEHIGNVADREVQVGLAGCPDGGGVFAPTIRHHEGTLYVIVSIAFSCQGRRRHARARVPGRGRHAVSRPRGHHRVRRLPREPLAQDLVHG
jgi:xylan 1,4-beta-xylosidase